MKRERKINLLAVPAAIILAVLLLPCNAQRAAFGITAQADLSVIKVGTPNPVTAGNNLSYTITVTNAGPDAAASAAFSDTLPAGTTFLSVTPAAGWSCDKPAVGDVGSISCATSSLVVGSAAVFTLTVNVNPSVAEGATIANTVTVSSSTSDPNLTNNTSAAATPVHAVEIPTTTTTTATTAAACVDNDGDGYGENCAAGPDCDDTDDFLYGICPEDCTVKVIPKALEWRSGEEEKTRTLILIGKKGKGFEESTAVRWEADAIQILSKQVFFKRFMLVKVSIDGEALVKGEYRVLIGECSGRLTFIK